MPEFYSKNQICFSSTHLLLVRSTNQPSPRKTQSFRNEPKFGNKHSFIICSCKVFSQTCKNRKRNTLNQHACPSTGGRGLKKTPSKQTPSQHHNREMIRANCWFNQSATINICFFLERGEQYAIESFT